MGNKNLKLIILGIIIGLPLLLIHNKNPTKLNSERIHLSEVNPWMHNGTAICTANGSQVYPQICSDGVGGAIITWQDRRSGWDNPQIYIQCVDSNGNVRWAPNGTIISSTASTYAEPQICSDGVGGAIITWQDRRAGEENYDIYAQRVDSNGNIMWTPNGLPICTNSSKQISPRIHSDGIGGAIIAWRDNRSGSAYDYHLYAQKVDSTGNIQWTSDGEIISTSEIFGYPSICSDGAGGAIFAWVHQWGGWTDRGIYTQRINSTGSIQWTANGIAICTANDAQDHPQVCSDGTGGAIISWDDNRNTLDYDIYVQRIDNNGGIKWTPNGTAICTMSGNQQYPQICNDGTGGAFITWRDERYGEWEDGDIFIQKVNSVGQIQWTSNGIPVCTAANLQGGAQIIHDGVGGAILTWLDYRSGSTSIGNGDLYAQKFNSKGIVQWISNGVAVYTKNEDQGSFDICSDGRGGAIVAWEGSLSLYFDRDIYAQYINSTGDIGVGVGDGNGDGNGDGSGDGNGNGIGIDGYNIYLLLGFILSISLISIKKKKYRSLKK